MKVHRTVVVHAASSDAAAFESELRRLCRQMPGWKFLVRQSKEYMEIASRPSYLIGFRGERGLPAAAVALTLKGGKKRLHFDSPNIVPSKSSVLSLKEYNDLAIRFVADLKRAPDYRSSGLRVQVTSGEVGLEEIIPGKKCRKFFLQYLNGYPLTYHGSDIQNLDVFICALYRFQAKVSPDDLSRYLTEDRGWAASDATWVCNRVRAGLELLTVDRRF